MGYQVATPSSAQACHTREGAQLYYYVVTAAVQHVAKRPCELILSLVNIVAFQNEGSLKFSLTGFQFQKLPFPPSYLHYFPQSGTFASLLFLNTFLLTLSGKTAKVQG